VAVQPEVKHPRKAYGWAARNISVVLSPFLFSRSYAKPMEEKL